MVVVSGIKQTPQEHIRKFRQRKEIAWSTGNQKLIQYLEEIEDFMRIARSLEKKTQAEQKCLRSVEQHWRIFKSIKARDKAEAEKAVTENIEQLRFHLGLKP